MKKQYIAPFLLEVELLEEEMIAESTHAGIDDSGNVDFNNPGAGDAGDAGVKGSSSIWDNEW